MDSLSAEVTGLTEQLETMKTDATASAGQISALEADVAEKTAQIKTLQTDVTEKTAQIETLQTDVSAKAGQIETLSAEVTEKSGQVAALQADVNEKAAQIDTLNEDVKELKALQEHNAAQVEDLKALFMETFASSSANTLSKLPDSDAVTVIKRFKVRAIDNPNVRKHPSIYAEGIGHATSSVVYEILDISENGWYQIRLDNGKIGWISPAMGELEELEFNFDPTVLPETADAAK